MWTTCLARVSSFILKMKYRSPAKLLRSIKRITKFIERKNTILPNPSVETIPAPPLAVPSPQITLAEFEALLKSENKKIEEQRRLERSEREEERRAERNEDLKRIQVLLGLPP